MKSQKKHPIRLIEGTCEKCKGPFYTVDPQDERRLCSPCFVRTNIHLLGLTYPERNDDDNEE